MSRMKYIRKMESRILAVRLHMELRWSWRWWERCRCFWRRRGSRIICMWLRWRCLCWVWFAVSGEHRVSHVWCKWEGKPSTEEVWSYDDFRADCGKLYADLSDCAAWTDGNCTLCIGVGSCNWRNSCQGILDQLSEVVFLSVVYRNGMAVCTGISSAVSGSFTAGIWMVAGGRHHLYGRRGDLLLKNADV